MEEVELPESGELSEMIYFAMFNVINYNNCDEAKIGVCDLWHDLYKPSKENSDRTQWTYDECRYYMINYDYIPKEWVRLWEIRNLRNNFIKHGLLNKKN